MRLLVSTPVYPPEIGGPAIYARSVSRFLVDRGHSVHVITFGAEEAFFEEAGWRVEKLARGLVLGRYLRYSRRIARRLEDSDALLCLDHLAWPAIRAGKVTSKPVALRIMVDPAWELASRFGWSKAGPDEFRKAKPGMRAAIVKRLQVGWWENAALVIVPSDYLSHVVQDYGFPSDRLTRVNNPYHGREPRHGEARDGGRASEDRASRIVIVARLVKWKRVEEAVRAFADLGPGWELRIIGEGPEEANIRQSIRETDTSQRVSLMGRLDHEAVLDQIEQADLLLSVSRYEGLSHTILEAMALGTPVVATAVGGNVEQLDHGKCGLLLSPEEPWNLERVLPAWLDSWAGHCVERARQRVRDLYSRDESFSRLECAILDMIDG